MSYDIWHSFIPHPKAIPCHYVRQQFRNGELIRSSSEVVYIAYLGDWPRLLAHWNKLGANPSHHGGYHYSYHATQQMEVAV